MLSPRWNYCNLSCSALRPCHRRLNCIREKHSLTVRLHGHRDRHGNVYVLLWWNLKRWLHSTADNDMLRCRAWHRVVRADEAQLRRQNFSSSRICVLTDDIPWRPVELINVIVSGGIPFSHQTLNLTRQLIVYGEGHVFSGVWSKVCHECRRSLWNCVNDWISSTNFHHLHASLHVVAMCIVNKVRECRELMSQCLSRLDSALLINRQHPLKQIDEFTAIDFLCQQLTAFDVHLHVHLPDVVETIEDVLSSLLRLDVCHDLVLLR